MKVKIYRENCTMPGNWIPIGQFDDLYHPTLFIQALLREANDVEENGSFKIEYEPIEYEED